jgi:ribosome recycling factor
MEIDKQQFEKAIEHLKQELSSLRIGRASTALVDNITIESYGSRMPISHVASINVTDVRTLTIQPWDKSNMAAIEKAIQISNIGINPVNDGVAIRLNIPPMTEERRKEMVKVVGQLEEQARVSIRNVREEIIKEVKKQEDDDLMTKDEVDDFKVALQEVIDSFNEKIKEVASAKEKEILTV